MKIKTKATILALTAILFISACGMEITEGEESFSLDAYGEVFSTDEEIFCLSRDEIIAYSPQGEKLCTEAYTIYEPRYDTAESCAVIFGETDFFSYDGKELRHNNVNNKIMSTAINKNGYIALCTEEAGYKGSVTVFDEKLQPIYKWYCTSGFIIKAALSEKNTLAVLTANEKGSTVHIFKLDSEDEEYSVFMEKTLAIDLGWLEDNLCIISENAAYFAAGDKISESFCFERKLGEYAMSNELVVLEMLNGDGTSELFSLDKDGDKKGSAQGEILRNLAVSGERIALISGSEAVLYNENLSEISRADARGVRNVMLCGEKMLLLRDSEISVIK